MTRPSVSSESVPIIHPRRRWLVFPYAMYASIILGAKVYVVWVLLESGMVY